MTASPFALKRLRSAAELADARAVLLRNGYTQCPNCDHYSNEEKRMAAMGHASRHLCPICGTDFKLVNA